MRGLLRPACFGYFGHFVPVNQGCLGYPTLAIALTSLLSSISPRFRAENSVVLVPAEQGGKALQPTGRATNLGYDGPLTSLKQLQHNCSSALRLERIKGTFLLLFLGSGKNLWYLLLYFASLIPDGGSPEVSVFWYNRFFCETWTCNSGGGLFFSSVKYANVWAADMLGTHPRDMLGTRVRTMSGMPGVQHSHSRCNLCGRTAPD